MNYLKWLMNVIKDFGVTGKLGLGNMWANINPTYSVIIKHILTLTRCGQVYTISKYLRIQANYF